MSPSEIAHSVSDYYVCADAVSIQARESKRLAQTSADYCIVREN